MKFKAKDDTGRVVFGQLTDLGVRLRTLTGQRREVYTSKITVAGKTFYSRVDREIADQGDPCCFRMSEDMAQMRARGVNTDEFAIVEVG